MKSKIIRHALLTVLVAWTLDTPTRAAEPAEAKEDPWRFSATVPLWAAGINGDVTVRGKTADVDVGFDDLFDQLDAAFSLAVEARKERYGFYGAFGYQKFSADATGQRGFEGDAELKLLIADAGMAYRLARVGEKHPFILEGLAGVRYWYIETDLKLTGPRGRVLVDSGFSKNLWDPIIGLRGSQYLAEKWHLDFQGDLGGFGITDDTAHFDWSATGLLTYDARKWLSLSAGYKALAVNVDGGSGSSKKGADLVMHGLLLSASLKF